VCEVYCYLFFGLALDYLAQSIINFVYMLKLNDHRLELKYESKDLLLARVGTMIELIPLSLAC
jgi:hypothetical protein